MHDNPEQCLNGLASSLDEIIDTIPTNLTADAITKLSEASHQIGQITLGAGGDSPPGVVEDCVSRAKDLLETASGLLSTTVYDLGRYSFLCGLRREPPLGKVPDFTAEKRAISQEALQVPFITPDEDRQIAPAWGSLVNFAQSFLSKFGLPAIEISPSSIHILSSDGMRQVARLFRSREDEGGIYDPSADVCYVELPGGREGVSGLVSFFYALSHELGHKLSPGLCHILGGGNPTVLREGLADKFAKQFMYDQFMPRYAPDVKQRIAHQFDSGIAYDFGPFLLRPEEILSIDPNTGCATGYSRIVEARIVDALEDSMGEDSFAELMRQSASGDTRAARRVVAGRLGIRVWELLTTNSPEGSLLDILAELRHR